MATLDDEFSAEEKAYLKSRGSDTESLSKAYSGRAEEAEDDEDERPAPKQRREEKPAREAPAASEEQDDDDDDDDDDEDGEGRASKSVPHGRFHKERMKARAARAEAQELKMKFARAEERLAILNEFALRGQGDDDDETAAKPNGQKPGKAAEKAKSAWDEADIDPIADFPAAMDQLKRRQAEDRAARLEHQETAQERQQQQEARTVDEQQSRHYVQDAISYQQKDPSFRDAYQHLMQTYHRELEAFGMADVKQRNAHIQQEEKKLAKWAIENKRSPAEVLYQVSVSRGFVKKAQQADETEDKPANEEVKAKIKNIERGQKSTASLSNAGGGSTKGLTMESILNMDDDEFFDKIHKLDPKKRRRVLGGG